MNSVDGDVRLSVKLDTKTIQTSAEELKTVFTNALKGFNIDNSITQNLEQLNQTITNVTNSLNELGDKLLNIQTDTTQIDNLSDSLQNTDEWASQTAEEIHELFEQIDAERESLNDKEIKVEISKDVDLSNIESIQDRITELDDEIEKLYNDWETQQQTLTEDTEEYNQVWAEIYEKISIAEKERGMLLITEQQLKGSGNAQQTQVEETTQAAAKANNVFTQLFDTIKNIFSAKVAPALKQSLWDLEGYTWNAINALRNAGDVVRDFFIDPTNQLRTTISNSSKAITNFNHKIIESIKNLIKHATASKTAKNSLDNFNKIIKKGIGFILKYGLGIRSTYILINKLKTAIKEGYKNLAGYSDEVNDSISSVLSSTAKLKNQLAAAFQPIVSVVVPVLNQLIDKLNESAVKISKFFAAWTGQEVVYTANNIQKKYVDNLEDTAKAAEEAEEALNGYLSPLDDINRYEERTTSKADEKNKDVTDYSKMFNTVAVDSQFKTLVTKIKNYLNQLFEPIKKSWEKYGGETIQKVKGTFESLLKTINSVHDSFLTVWTGSTGQIIVDNILKTFININTIITNISENFRKAWDTGVGLSIVEKIAGIFETILTHITNITQKTAEWSSSVNFEPLLTALNGVLTPLKDIFDLAGQWTEKVWETVFLPLVSWTIEEAVPAALDAISGALSLIKEVGEKAGEWLGIIWDNFLSKVADFVGDNIVNFLTVLGQTLKDVSKNEKAVTVLTAVGTAILTIAIGIQMLNVALIIIAALKAMDPFTWILIALAAIVVVIVEVITYWDILKQAWQDGVKDLKKRFPATVKFFEETITNIKTIFKGIIKFISGVFTNDWEKTWDGVKTIVKGIFDSMVTIVKTPINLIISMINRMIQGVADKINIVAAFLNSFGVDIPDWVPGIGGGHLSFNIPYMEAPQIPLLAQGAVIPPNREFLAVLGDQKQGKNIETPESLLRQIMREELNGNNGNVYNVSAKVRQKTLFDVVIDEARLRQGQTGRNPFNLT